MTTTDTHERFLLVTHYRYRDEHRHVIVGNYIYDTAQAAADSLVRLQADTYAESVTGELFCLTYDTVTHRAHIEPVPMPLPTPDPHGRRSEEVVA